jgi:hypothetical protein
MRAALRLGIGSTASQLPLTAAQLCTTAAAA